MGTYATGARGQPGSVPAGLTPAQVSRLRDARTKLFAAMNGHSPAFTTADFRSQPFVDTYNAAFDRWAVDLASPATAAPDPAAGATDLQKVATYAGYAHAGAGYAKNAAAFGGTHNP